jgi:hypothetical protein
MAHERESTVIGFGIGSLGFLSSFVLSHSSLMLGPSDEPTENVEEPHILIAPRAESGFDSPCLITAHSSNTGCRH